MSKISQYTALSSTQSDDVLPIVDVHDTTQASSGTTKKITVSNLLAGAGGGTVTSVTAADTSIVVSGTPTTAPAIATGTLDVVAAQHAPAANWSNNSHKITSLANGSGAQDAAAFGQTPAGGSTVTIAQGGTGQVSAAAALNALGGAAVAGDIGGTSASPQVTGTHLASGLPVAQGGTGQTAQQAAMDALAGAVTSGQVLRGNGTHVTMSAIAAADLPAGTTGTQGALRADGTAADIQPIGTQTAGAVGKAADAGHIHPYEPWQFYVGAYGAKGDGRIVGDGAMSSSVNPTFLTSATANFISGDVGKNVVVNGALGASNAPLYTTIASVTNSTTAVLNASATNTVSAAAVFLASDDSAAIVSAITAASTYAQANNWKAQVIFDAKSYGLATLTTTAASGALAQQNALVPIPYPNVNGTTQKLNFELVGVGEAADEQYFDSTIPSMTGTALVATVAASGSNPSIVGGPNASTNLSGTWINTKAVIRGITVWAGFNPGWVGWDLRQCAAVWIDDAGAQVLAPAGGGQNPGLVTVPTNTSGWGFILPANNDNGAGRLMVEGFYQGVGVSPRTTIEKLFTQSNAIAVFARTVNATVTHGARIGYWSCNVCTTAIGSTGTSGTMPLVIDMFDSAGAITTDLSDAHGTLVGSMNWWHTTSTTPNVAAGFAMRIVNLRVNPGPMSSPPSAPSSGSASTAIYRDTEVTLSLSGGTMTALTIGGVDQHIPASCVLWKITVPTGYTYTPTYTGALTTDVTVL